MTVKETLEQIKLELQHNIQIISNRTDRLDDKITNISNESKTNEKNYTKELDHIKREVGLEIDKLRSDISWMAKMLDGIKTEARDERQFKTSNKALYVAIFATIISFSGINMLKIWDFIVNFFNLSKG